ncbi:unnamed protein product [Cuscuta epithymum]|uniref:Splicing factor 3B subunit 1 domain-containing protein n=1 Tax=Cuscuta epithymum TaxID=186058 RepID=A0AAV0F9F7_9ASTE|nr:unnamed protein product [Cuscuta epithymum]
MDDQILKTQDERKKMEQQLAYLNLTAVTFDTDLYSFDRFEGYEKSIPVNDDEDAFENTESEIARKMASFTAPKQFLTEASRGGGQEDLKLGFRESRKIVDREDEYRRRGRLNRVLSPDRYDPFSDKTPGPDERTYADVMREEELMREIAKKKEEEAARTNAEKLSAHKRRNRWYESQDRNSVKEKKEAKPDSDWDLPDSTPAIGGWDEDATPKYTPGRVGDPTPSRVADSMATPLGGGATPGAAPAAMTWDSTPKNLCSPTPAPKRQRSRWDETPGTMGSATSMEGATPSAAYTPDVTPFGGSELDTPSPGSLNLRSSYTFAVLVTDMNHRSLPLTDEELDMMLPQEGYKILEAPYSYCPIINPARKLLPEENRGRQFDMPKAMPGGIYHLL